MQGGGSQHEIQMVYRLSYNLHGDKLPSKFFFSSRRFVAILPVSILTLAKFFNLRTPQSQWRCDGNYFSKYSLSIYLPGTHWFGQMDRCGPTLKEVNV